MINAYKKFWHNYTNFSGKSSRSDYWFAYLMNFIIYLIAIIILGFYLSISGLHGYYNEVSSANGVNFSFEASGIFIPVMFWIIFIFSLAIILPSLAISIRRLHDAGFHWAFIFLNLIPTIGSIVLLIFHCLPSNDSSENTMIRIHHSDPEELERWYQLKEKNVITEDEYNLKKKELL